MLVHGVIEKSLDVVHFRRMGGFPSEVVCREEWAVQPTASRSVFST